MSAQGGFEGPQEAKEGHRVQGKCLDEECQRGLDSALKATEPHFNHSYKP